MAEEKTTRPQHLTTLLDVAPKGEWPSSWKDNPETLRLVGLHQQWLANPITLKLRHLLSEEVKHLALNVGSQAVTPGISSEQVRVTAAQLKQTTELEKTIYDTAKFIEAVTRTS